MQTPPPSGQLHQTFSRMHGLTDARTDDRRQTKFPLLLSAVRPHSFVTVKLSAVPRVEPFSHAIRISISRRGINHAKMHDTVRYSCIVLKYARAGVQPSPFSFRQKARSFPRLLSTYLQAAHLLMKPADLISVILAEDRGLVCPLLIPMRLYAGIGFFKHGPRGLRESTHFTKWKFSSWQYPKSPG